MYFVLNIYVHIYTTIYLLKTEIYGTTELLSISLSKNLESGFCSHVFTLLPQNSV